MVFHLKKACDKFTYTENLEEDQVYELIDITLLQEDKAAKDVQDTKDKSSLKLQQNQELIKLVKNAYEAIAREDGWAYLALMGTQLNKLSPAFDSRNFGYKKLGELIRAIDIFEVKETLHEKTPAVKDLYIKLRN